jgi:hypothetical protein
MLITIKRNIIYLILVSLINLTLFQNHYLICSEGNGKTKVETYNNNCCIEYNSYHNSIKATSTLSQNQSQQLSEYCIDTEYNASLYNKNSSFNDLIKVISQCIITSSIFSVDNPASSYFDFTDKSNSQQSSIISSNFIRI